MVRLVLAQDPGSVHFQPSLSVIWVFVKGLSYGPDGSPGRSIRIEDDLCLNDALLETDSLIHDIKDIKSENISDVNAISDDSCGEQSFDSVEFVQEEEVECEEVFDSAYFIDTNSCEFLVKITYL